ncbi:putative ubiquitin carboxyl-terminal hydrolase domain-containing protein [Neospora caninum Liverpool]|uniref:Putative ubiquitin carboxyl-terminal hydrolase domain-containing protein n=1 Tax=Neospora caninum (strain Liverpool) TaxID=572307 RepID=F0VNQ4_NEOCL|nr:putative ubiquitin carboxyl-terminal hydrolase domain-containing protein [Neospora caninum Liverpool]CBZ55350.1 putative ubiquitin carboxyl-terminal hydrolase domain-containing protein [Neospora caninum Liverpool]CEL70085.1 TPA: ubiquitin carboxyl-terminal hydrolase domain-containing protein, putative [Neospora caninum Liverpool]|eukprot:XP_003885378.1 putative ubiquitin carboxyl-terminal hydrolase domain-containing protein [Neospora caninum Liverpool]
MAGEGGEAAASCACERPPPGLLNLGKTCSFNVLLQALAATRTFSTVYGAVWHEHQRSRSPSSDLLELVRRQRALLRRPAEAETRERGRTATSRSDGLRSSVSADASARGRPRRWRREAWCGDAAAVGRAAAPIITASRTPLNYCMADILGRMHAGEDSGASPGAAGGGASLLDNASPATASQSPLACTQPASVDDKEDGGAPQDDPEKGQKEMMRRQLRLKRQLQTKRWWIKQEQNVLSPFDFVSQMRMLNVDFEQDVELDVEEVWRFLIQQIFTELQSEQASLASPDDVSVSSVRGLSAPTSTRREEDVGSVKGEGTPVSASVCVPARDRPGFFGGDSFPNGILRPVSGFAETGREAGRGCLANEPDGRPSRSDCSSDLTKTHQASGTVASSAQVPRPISSPQRALGPLRSSALSHSMRGGGASDPRPRHAAGAVAVPGGAFSASCTRLRTHCVRGLSPRSVPRESEVGREESERERAERRAREKFLSASYHFLAAEAVTPRGKGAGAEENAGPWSPLRRSETTEPSAERSCSASRLASALPLLEGKSPGPSPRRDGDAAARCCDAGQASRVAQQSPGRSRAVPGHLKARLRLPSPPGAKLEAPVSWSDCKPAEIRTFVSSPVSGIQRAGLCGSRGRGEESVSGAPSGNADAKQEPNVKGARDAGSLAAVAQQQGATLLLRQLQQALVGRLVQVPVPCSCCCRCEAGAPASVRPRLQTQSPGACRSRSASAPPTDRSGRVGSPETVPGGTVLSSNRERKHGSNDASPGPAASSGSPARDDRSEARSLSPRRGLLPVESRRNGVDRRGNVCASPAASPSQSCVHAASGRSSPLSVPVSSHTEAKSASLSRRSQKENLAPSALAAQDSPRASRASSPEGVNSARSGRSKGSGEAKSSSAVSAFLTPSLFPSSLATHPVCTPLAPAVATSGVQAVGLEQDDGTSGIEGLSSRGDAMLSLLSVESFCGVLPVRLPERSRWVSSRARTNTVGLSGSSLSSTGLDASSPLLARADSTPQSADSAETMGGSRRISPLQPITLEECLALAFQQSCGGASPSGGAAAAAEAGERKRGREAARRARPAGAFGGRRRLSRTQRRVKAGDAEKKTWRGTGPANPGSEGGKHKCLACGKWRVRRRGCAPEAAPSAGEGENATHAAGSRQGRVSGAVEVEGAERRTLSRSGTRTSTRDTTPAHSEETAKNGDREAAPGKESQVWRDSRDAFSCYQRLVCHRCNQVHMRTFLERLPEILLFQLPRSSITPPGTFGSGAVKAAAAAAGGGFKIKAHVEFPQRLESVIAPHCVASPAFEAAWGRLMDATGRPGGSDSSGSLESDGGTDVSGRRKRRKLSSQRAQNRAGSKTAGTRGEGKAVHRRVANSVSRDERPGTGAATLSTLAGTAAAPDSIRHTLQHEAGVYTLRAVIEHQGRSGVGGHYVCYRRGAPCDLVVETRENGEHLEGSPASLTSLSQAGAVSFSAAPQGEARRGVWDDSAAVLENSPREETPEEGTWWEVNDAEVTQTTWDHVRLSQAYILVYERCDENVCCSRFGGDRRVACRAQVVSSPAFPRTGAETDGPTPAARGRSGPRCGALSGAEKNVPLVSVQSRTRRLLRAGEPCRTSGSCRRAEGRNEACRPETREPGETGVASERPQAPRQKKKTSTRDTAGEGGHEKSARGVCAGRRPRSRRGRSSESHSSVARGPRRAGEHGEDAGECRGRCIVSGEGERPVPLEPPANATERRRGRRRDDGAFLWTGESGKNVGSGNRQGRRATRQRSVASATIAADA